MFEIVKKYYDKKIYSKKDVQVFVEAGKITADEYDLITGEAL